MKLYVYVFVLSIFINYSCALDQKTARDSIIKCGGRLWEVKALVVT